MISRIVAVTILVAGAAAAEQPMPSDATHEKVAAIWELRSREALSKEDLAFLRERLNDPDSHIRRAAVGVLAWRKDTTDPEVLAAFVSLAGDPDTSIRFWALTGLANAGTRVEGALGAVKEVTGDPDSDLARRAVWAMGRLARFEPEAMAELRSILESGDGGARREALKALAESGVVGLDILIAAMGDLDWGVADEARQALTKMPEKRELAARLTIAVDHSNPRIASQAARLLGELGEEQGRPAIAALVWALATREIAVRREAAVALATVGKGDEEAARALAEARLLDRDSSVRSAAAEALEKIGIKPQVSVETLIALLESGTWEQKTEAARELASLGPGALPAKGALLAAFQNPDTWGELRDAAASALVATGDDVAPEFARFLGAENYDIGAAAERALVSMGARALSAIEKVLRSGDFGRSYAAFQVLGGLGEIAIPVLENGLSHEDRGLRQKAVESLGSMGPVARVSMGRLIEVARQDPDYAVRGGAIRALVSIAGDEGGLGPAVPALLDALRAPPWDELQGTAGSDLARAAEDAMQALSPSDTDAVGPLREALADFETDVRKNAAWGLFRLGPAAGSAVDPLLVCLEDEELEVRLAATSALAAIGRPALPGLAGVLRAGSQNARSAAAEAFGKMEAAASEAAGSLVESVQYDPDPWVARQAAHAIGRVGPSCRDATGTLLQWTRSGDWGTREAAAIALGGIGPATPEVVPALLALVGDAEKPVRKAAVAALGRIGPVDGRIVPAVAGVLAEGDSDLGYAAGQALAKMGADGVPALVELLRREEWEVRSHARDALVAIGQPALGPLRAALESIGEEYRWEVEGAIQSIENPPPEKAIAEERER